MAQKEELILKYAALTAKSLQKEGISEEEKTEINNIIRELQMSHEDILTQAAKLVINEN